MKKKKRVWIGWIESCFVNRAFNWSDEGEDTRLQTSGEGIFKYRAKPRFGRERISETKIRITVEEL